MSDAPTKKRGPQWVNSYESQLSDSELLWLHTALLAHHPSDKAIIAKMPVWRDGPRKGQPVSKATLSNIRDRLEAEEDYQAAEANALAMVRERQAREPELSAPELEEYGQRVFTELTILRKDMAGFVTLTSARGKALLEKAKLELKVQAEQRQREALVLEKERFRRETCSLFLKWAEDRRALDIASGTAPNSQKIEALGQLMFGDDWKADS